MLLTWCTLITRSALIMACATILLRTAALSSFSQRPTIHVTDTKPLVRSVVMPCCAGFTGLLLPRAAAHHRHQGDVHQTKIIPAPPRTRNCRSASK